MISDNRPEWAMVYGDGRPYNVALIVRELDAVERWAEQQDRKVHGDDIVNDPDVLELIAREIATQTDGLPGYERVRELTLLGDNFTTDNGMLTPKLKLRRPIVRDRFGEQLEDLYP